MEGAVPVWILLLAFPFPHQALVLPFQNQGWALCSIDPESFLAQAPMAHVGLSWGDEERDLTKMLFKVLLLSGIVLHKLPGLTNLGALTVCPPVTWAEIRALWSRRSTLEEKHLDISWPFLPSLLFPCPASLCLFLVEGLPELSRTNCSLLGATNAAESGGDGVEEVPWPLEVSFP